MDNFDLFVNNLNYLNQDEKDKLIQAGIAMKEKKHNPFEVMNLFDLKGSNKIKIVFLLKEYYCHLFQKLVKGSLNNIKMILLVGPPGSGKSTFAYNLLLAYGTSIICHLNQDEIGKSECLKLTSQDKRIILLDRCNIGIKARKEFTDLIEKRKGSIICVNFRYSSILCKERVSMRKMHDMKNSNVIDMVSKNYEPPTEFKEIIEIYDENSLKDAYERFGIKRDLHFKFPRTEHLYYTGSNIRDDLVLPIEKVTEILSKHLIIEEKIDGANLGIYMINGSITFQNRGKTLLTDKQFESLHSWYEQNKFDIHDILSKGNYIIYGEWIYATHSIHYTKLPGYFIVFDIYDRHIEKFLSRERVNNLIKETNLPLINLMTSGNFSLQDLILLLDGKSSYCNGSIEGIYIRTEENGYLTSRSKIVRSEFINNINEHWSSHKLIVNSIAYMKNS